MQRALRGDSLTADDPKTDQYAIAMGCPASGTGRRVVAVVAVAAAAAAAAAAVVGGRWWRWCRWWR
jgi:hypothetical protein